MNLRLATAEDKPRLIEMAVRFLLESSYGEFFDAWATPQSISVLIDNVLRFGAILVAEVPLTHTEEDRVELVGMLALIALPHPLTGQIYADEIAWWVDPEHRGGTLGPKMLRAAEDWATTNGANMVKMVAPAGSTVGSFYERIGYRPVESAFIKRI